MGEFDSGKEKGDMQYLTGSEVQRFASENKVGVNSKLVSCGDGRYIPEQNPGAIRVFGADFGLLAAIAGASLKTGKTFSNSDLEDLVGGYSSTIKSLRGEDAKMHYHSDDHTEKGLPGCGHIKALMQGENGKVFKSLFQIFKNHPNSQETVLNGKHLERAIVRVQDYKMTINSFGTDEGSQVFLVQPPIIAEEIGRIVHFMQIPGLNVEDVKRVQQEQTLATAIELAPGMPIYDVRFAEGIVSAAQVGNVPTAVAR